MFKVFVNAEQTFDKIIFCLYTFFKVSVIVMEKVAIFKCEEYTDQQVMSALKQALDAFGGAKSFAKPGQLVVIKANMVIKFAPERCATTHPVVVGCLAKLFLDEGAKVVVADSAGGPYNDRYMGAIYDATGMTDASKKYGFEMNSNYGTVCVEYSDAKVAKKFNVLDILQKADVIVNACKLKSHSFTGISNAVKNMFGAIPGLDKVQMHGQFQTLDSFSDMLFDIWGFFGNKMALSVCDAVVGMEGEGPTNGKPRKIGAIMCSPNPVALDVVGARVMNVDPAQMPTITKGVERNYLGAVDDFEVVGEPWQNFVLTDFDKRTPNPFKPFSNSVPQWLQPILHKLTTQRPYVSKRKCVGCQTCFRHCPVHAISMVAPKKGGVAKAKFDYSKCIRCFCCQELCPYGLVKVKSGIVYKVLHGKSKKDKSK